MISENHKTRYLVWVYVTEIEEETIKDNAISALVGKPDELFFYGSNTFNMFHLLFLTFF